MRRLPPALAASGGRAIGALRRLGRGATLALPPLLVVALLIGGLTLASGDTTTKSFSFATSPEGFVADTQSPAPTFVLGAATTPTTANASSIAAPSIGTHAVGDLIIAAVSTSVAQASNPTLTGYTFVRSIKQTDVTYGTLETYLYYKRATATTGEGVAASFSNSTRASYAVVLFRGVDVSQLATDLTAASVRAAARVSSTACEVSAGSVAPTNLGGMNVFIAAGLRKANKTATGYSGPAGANTAGALSQTTTAPSSATGIRYGGASGRGLNLEQDPRTSGTSDELWGSIVNEEDCGRLTTGMALSLRPIAERTYVGASGNPAGALRTRIGSGSGGAVTATWTWTGTWEDLNVPVGATVNSITLTAASSKATYTSGTSLSYSRWQLLDASGAALGGTANGGAGLLNAARTTATSDASFQTVSGAAVTLSSSRSSESRIRLRLSTTVTPGTSTAAGFEVLDDLPQLTIDYTPDTTAPTVSDFSCTPPPGTIITASLACTTTFSELPAAPGNRFVPATDLQVGGDSSSWASAATADISWVQRTPPNALGRRDAVYGEGLFVAVGDSGSIATSPDGVTWTAATSPTTNRLNSVTFGEGLFVAVGQNGTVVTSPDGVTWTEQMRASSANLSGVAYGNGRYLAVGTSQYDGVTGVIVTSLDGVNWGLGTPPVGIPESPDASFGNGLFLLTASSSLYTSADGATWTPQVDGFSGTINATAYGNGLYVGVGSGGEIRTSPNGQTWTGRSHGGGTANLMDITYGAGRFLVSALGLFLTSSDGVTWSSSTGFAGVQPQGVAAGEQRYVAVAASGEVISDVGAGPYSFTVTRGAPSSDGSLTLTLPAGSISDAAGNSSTASSTLSYTIDTTAPSVSSFTSAASSPTNSTSIAYTLSFSEAVSGIAGGLDGAVGNDFANAILSTSGGATGCTFTPSAASGTTITLTVTTCSTTGTLQPRLLANGVTDTAGNTGPAANSDATTTLTLDRVAPTLDAFSCDPAPGSIATTSLTCSVLFSETAGSNGFTVGSDLTIGGTSTTWSATAADSWALRTSTFGSRQIFKVAYGDNHYIAIGVDGGAIATSSDATTWTSAPAPLGASPLADIAYGNGLWVAVGANALIVTSPDKTTWTQQSASIGTANLSDVAYANGTWILLGSGGTIATSPDAITWTPRSSGFGSAFGGLAYGSGVWVAVGANGTILTSSNNGASWSTVATSSFGTTSINDVTYGGGQFVAVGSSGKLATSPDGTTWTQRTSSFSTTIIGEVVHGAGLYVAGGDSGKLATSVDGITWTQRNSGFGTSNITGVTYGAGRFVAGGQSGKLASGSVVDIFTFTVSRAAPNSDGTLTLQIPSGAVSDGAGNSLAAASSTLSYTIDTVAPTASSTATVTGSGLFRTGSDGAYTIYYGATTPLPTYDPPAGQLLFTYGMATGNSVVTVNGVSLTINCAAPGATTQTCSFTVPAGVGNMSAVLVGGGGAGEAASTDSDGGNGGALRYVPSVTAVVGAPLANTDTISVTIGRGGQTSAATGGSSSIARNAVTFVTAGGGAGNNGTNATSTTTNANILGFAGGNGRDGSSSSAGGGGGAGGYSAAGGAGGAAGSATNAAGAASTGGGGGGGANSPNATTASGKGGGGVGLCGAGSNGTAGTGAAGGGGSAGTCGDTSTSDVAGGTDGSAATSAAGGGLFGGGGGGAGVTGGTLGVGGNGGVRLIWGTGRAYPSTNTADATWVALNSQVAATSDQITVTHTLTDSGSGIATASCPATITGFTLSASLPSLPAAPGNATMICTYLGAGSATAAGSSTPTSTTTSDAAGNGPTTVLAGFTGVQDATAPSLSFTLPAVSSTSGTLTWSTVEAGSGIATAATVVRQVATPVSNACSAVSWANDTATNGGTTTASGTLLTLTDNRCYRWTADPSITATAVKPVDNVGNSLANGTTAALTGSLTSPAVLIDATKPVSTGSVAATMTTSATISVSYTASDAGSGVTSVAAYVSTSSALTSPSLCGSVTSGAASGTISCVIPSPADGTYYLYTRATDAAGNVEDAPATPTPGADDSIAYDATAPSVTAGSPSATTGVVVVGSTVYYGATTLLSGSPLTQTSYQVVGTYNMASNDYLQNCTTGATTTTCDLVLPIGVSSISGVVIGGGGGGGTTTGLTRTAGGSGGGLAYSGVIDVSGCATLKVVIGAGGTNGGDGGASSLRCNGSALLSGGGGQGGSVVSIFGNSGGASGGSSRAGGGSGGFVDYSIDTNTGPRGGGGAGGYSAAGGSAGLGAATGTAGNGGTSTTGGGGGAGNLPATGGSVSAYGFVRGGNGGGVGLFGPGANGSGGVANGGNGGAGSGGSLQTYGGGGGGIDYNNGGNCTSGAAACIGENTPAAGGAGAVRIIWGAGRSYPSTNVADVALNTGTSAFSIAYALSDAGQIASASCPPALSGFTLSSAITPVLPSGSSTLTCTYAGNGGATPSGSTTPSPGSASDTGGNSTTFAAGFTGVQDATGPSVTGFTYQTASDTGRLNNDLLTNAATLSFDLVFDEPVIDLDASAFSNSGSATGCIFTPAGSGTTYTVTVSDCSDGTLVATFAAGGAYDATFTASPSSATADVTITIDRTAPTLTLARVTASPTNSTSISFTLTGNEPLDCSTISPADEGDFIFDNIIAPLGTITGSGTTICTIAATSSIAAGTSGSSRLEDDGSFSVSDDAGNAQTAISGTPASITVDRVVPTITTFALQTASDSGRLSTDRLTNASSPIFDLVFSESMAAASIASGDFSNTGTATGCTFTPAGSGTTFTVTASSCSAGTLILTLAEAGVTDPAGNTAPATATAAATVTIDRTAPTLTLAAVTASPTTSTSLSFTLTAAARADGSIDPLNCGTISTTLSSLNDFTASNISGSLTRTGSGTATCEITATSSIAGGATGSSTLTEASGFSVADDAGNAQVNISAGSPASITVDRQAPSVSVFSCTPTEGSISATILDCSLTFSEAPGSNAFDPAADLTIGGTSTTWSAGSATGTGVGPYTFTVSRGAPNSDGTLTLQIRAGAIDDAATNSSSASGTRSYTIDTVAPSVTWVSYTGVGRTSATTISFTFRFDEPVFGIAAGDFVNAGTATGCIFTPSTASTSLGSEDISLSVTGCGPSGTLIPRMLTNSVSDTAGNLGPTADSTTFDTITLDRIAPIATIALQTASDSGRLNSDNLTNAAAPVFTVTFDETVDGFSIDTADFSNVGTASCSVNSVNTGGASPLVTLSCTTEGTVILRLAAGGISDTAGNGAAQTDSPTVTRDTTAPTLALAAVSTSPTNSTSLVFTLSAGEALNCGTISTATTDFTRTNITTLSSATGSGTDTCTIPATSSISAGTSGSSSLTQSGTFSVADDAGNAQTTIATGSPASITVDRVVPTVSSFTSVVSSPTNSTSIAYTLTLSESVSGIAAGDFTNAGSATGCTFTPSAASGTTITLTVTTCSATGTLQPRLAANGVTDDATNTGPAANADATTTLTLDRVAPTVSSFTSAVSSPTNSTSIAYTLAFSESVSGIATGDFTNAGSATGCTFTPSVSSGTTITLTVTGCSTTGTLQPRLAANGVTDTATNTGPAANADATTTLTLDRVAPTTGSASITESAASLHASGTTLFYQSASAQSSSFTVSLTPTDNITISTVAFPTISGLGTDATNGATDSSSPYSNAYVFGTGSLTATGSQTITVTDTATNSATTSITLIADTNAPTLTWTTPAAAVTISTTAYTPAWSISDPNGASGSGLAVAGTIARQRTALTANVCDAGGWVNDSTNATSVTAASGTALTLVSGYCYRWTASSVASVSAVTPVDNVGNATTANLTSGVVKVDTVAPTVAYACSTDSGATWSACSSAYYTGALWVRATVSDTGGSGLAASINSAASATYLDSIDSTCDDAAAGTTSCLFVWKVTSNTTGTDFTVTSPTDTAGNVGSSGSQNGKRDAETPSVAFACSTTALTTPVGSATFVACSSSTFYTSDVRIRATFTDTVSGLSPPALGSANATDSTCDDVASGVGSCTLVYRLTSDTTGTTYSVAVSDLAGNSSGTVSQTITRDAVAPTTGSASISESSTALYATGTTLFYNSATAQSAGFTVSLSPSDATSGVASVTFPTISGLGTGADNGATDSSSPYSNTYTFGTGSLTASGAQTLTVADAAGNSATTTFTLTADGSGPSVSWSNPGAGTTLSSSSSITLSFATSDSGVGLASASLQREKAAMSIPGSCAGVAWSADGSPADILGDTSRAVTGLDAGYCYRWTITAIDRVGNETTSTSGALLTDSSDPAFTGANVTVSGDAYRSGSTIYIKGSTGGSLTLTAAPSDPQSAVVSVTFGALTSGTGYTADLPSVDTTDPYTTSITYTGSAVASGLRLTATNGVSGTTAVDLSIVPDGTGPTITFTSPTAFTMQSSTTISAAWTESDASGVASRSVQRQQASTSAAGVCPGANSESWSNDGSATSTASPRSDSNLTAARCYRYVVIATDNLGNESTTTSAALLVDETAPSTPSVSESGANSYLSGSLLFFRAGSSGSLTVGASSSDAESEIARLRFAGSSTTGWSPALPIDDTTSPYESSLDWSGSATGGWTLAVTARNGAGSDSSTVELTLVADGSAPSATFTTPAGGAQAGTSLVLEWTESDAGSASGGSGVASRSLQRYKAAITTPGSCPPENTAEETYWTADGSPLTTASPVSVTGLTTATCYKWTLTLTDRVGNEGTSTSSTLLVDTTAPAAPTVSAAGSGVASSANGVVFFRPAAAATLTLSVSPTNAALLDAESGLAAISFSALATGTTTGWSPTGATTDSSAPFERSYTFAAEAGSTSLTMSATNGAGTTGSATTVTITADAEAPDANFSNPNEGATVGVTDGTASIAWSESDGTGKVVPPGDPAEPGSGVATRSLQRQKVAISGAACPNSGWSNDGEPATVSSPHSDSGLQSGYCYRYRLTLTDAVGNSATYTSGELIVDSTAPDAPTITASGAKVHQDEDTIYFGAGSGTISLTATASDDGSGIKLVSFGAVDDETSPYERDLAFTNSTDAFSLSVTATNGADTLSNAVELSFTPDRTGPSAAFTSPLAAVKSAARSLTVVWSASDAASGLATLTLQRETAAIESPGLCATDEADWSTDGSAATVAASGSRTEGTLDGIEDATCYRYRLIATDNVGNETETVSTTFLVDTTAPTTPSATATGSNVYQAAANATIYFRAGTTGTIAISASASDAESGIASINFSRPVTASSSGWTATPTLPVTDAVSPYALALDWSASAGSTELEIAATNGAGSPAAANRTLTITADADAPTVTISAPTSNGYSATGAITLTWSETETGSGVASRSIQRYRALIPGSAACADATSWNADGLTTTAGSPREDTGLASGYCYRYGITATDRVGNTSSEVFSAATAVDSSAPDAPTLTVVNDPAGALYVAPNGTVYVGTAAGGSLTLTASATDNQSGIVSYTFAALANTTGWSPTGAETKSPAQNGSVEKTYTYSGGASSATFAVRATNGAGALGSPASLTLVADGAGPEISWITPEQGTTNPSSSALSLVFSVTDAGSGLASTSLQRQAAATVNGICPAAGSFANDGAAIANATSPRSVTGLSIGSCYRWILTATDHVGQESSATSGVVRIDSSYALSGIPATLDYGNGKPGDLVSVNQFEAIATAGGPYALTIEVSDMTRVGGSLATGDLIPRSAFRFSINGTTYYAGESGIITLSTQSGSSPTNGGDSYLITPRLLIPFVSTGTYGGTATFTIDGIGQ